MTVMADIVTAVEKLLDGTLVPDRAIPVGRFSVVGDDHDWEQAPPDQAPYPCYIEDGEETEDETMPSDVSGDYHYTAKILTIYIGYGFNPDDDATDRTEVMVDDAMAIRRCFIDPLTWAEVTGWVGAEVKISPESIYDADGVVAIKYNVVTMMVSFREDLS